MAEILLTDTVLLFASGVGAGMVNALAGGGTLITFPMFIALGLPPVVANASNAVAVWPGHAIALVQNRGALLSSVHLRTSIGKVTALSILGGVAGVVVLQLTGNRMFEWLVPPLVGVATLVFALAPRVRNLKPVSASLFSTPMGQVMIFIVAAYGGFFGAGLGVTLMGVLLLAGVCDPKENSALKNLIATLVTTASVLALAVSGLVAWRETGIAFAGAMCGGLAGGALIGRAPTSFLRTTVIGIGLALTLYYAVKYYR